MNRIPCKTIICLMVIAIGREPANAADPDIASYNRCVADEAVRLSAGSDAADLIARSAAVLCNSKFAALLLRVPDLFPTLENNAVGEATIAILEARAKRR